MPVTSLVFELVDNYITDSVTKKRLQMEPEHYSARGWVDPL